MAQRASRRSTGLADALDRHRRHRPAQQCRLSGRALPRAGFPQRRFRHRLHRPQSRQRSAPRRKASTAPPPRSARRNLLAREHARIAAAIEREPDEPASPWDAADAFQLSGARRLALPILADGEDVVAQVVHGAARHVGHRRRHRAGHRRGGGRGGRRGLCAAPRPPDQGRACAISPSTRLGITARGGLVRAPMHGKVLAFWWSRASRVTRGQRLAIIEAMKMEHTLVAPIDGTVAEIAVAKDAQVAEGAKVMVIEPRCDAASLTRGLFEFVFYRGCFYHRPALMLLVHLHAEKNRQRPARQQASGSASRKARRVLSCCFAISAASACSSESSFIFVAARAGEAATAAATSSSNDLSSLRSPCMQRSGIISYGPRFCKWDRCLGAVVRGIPAQGQPVGSIRAAARPS